MALIHCPECKKKISEDAESCPGCGRQISQDELAEIKNKEIQKNTYQKLGCALFLAPFIIAFIAIIFIVIEDSYEKKKAESRSYCYDIGFEYGKCKAQKTAGISCDSEGDVIIPDECRDLGHTERGIKAGADRVKRQQEKLKKEQEIQEAIKRGNFPRAFRSIYFGDSKVGVDTKIREDDEIGSDKTITLAGEVYCKLDFKFWENQLYSVAFYKHFPFTNPTDPELIKQRDFFVSLIKEQYGPPSAITGPIWSERYLWTPESLGEQKRIRILTINFEGGGFTPLMEIYFPPFFDEYNKAKEAAEKEKARKEREEAREKKREAAQDF